MNQIWSSVPPLALLLVAWPDNLLAQPRLPSFNDYRTTEGPFSGKPAPPVFKRVEDRRFRSVIRESAAHGPNFDGHYTIAEWGCGAGCVSVVLVDALTGAISPGPFRKLGWELRRYEGEYASNDEKFQQLEYSVRSRLLVARGCREEGNCASTSGSGQVRDSSC